MKRPQRIVIPVTIPSNLGGSEWTAMHTQLACAAGAREL
jgi:hypothetical protein